MVGCGDMPMLSQRFVRSVRRISMVKVMTGELLPKYMISIFLQPMAVEDKLVGTTVVRY
jgi:hypothetical protein